MSRLPASRASRYDSLDHWRGLACLLVIVYHSTLPYLASPAAAEGTGAIAAALAFTHHFNVGVAMFFVISGYCIAAAADNARARGDGIGSYFKRRFRRIYPPFWILVLLSIASFFVLDYGWREPLLSRGAWPQLRPTWLSPAQWFGNLTLIESWRDHAFGGPKGQFVQQAWTLNYEEQFYFVTGMVLVASRRRFYLGIAAVSAVTVPTMVWSGVTNTRVNGFFFDGSWLLFAAGVAVFYRIRYTCGWRARAIDLTLLAAIPVSVWISVPIPGSALGFALAALLPRLYEFDRRIASSSALKPLLICGQMCYSLYLIHQIPVKAIATVLGRNGAAGPLATLVVAIPLSIGVSVGLGWLFHITVERRFLNTPASVMDWAENNARRSSVERQAPGEVVLRAA